MKNKKKNKIDNNVLDWVDKFGLNIENHVWMPAGRLTGLCIISVILILLSLVIALIFKKATIATALFAAGITVSTWAYVQHRTYTHIVWEAIRDYYTEGDKENIVKARKWLACDAINDSTEELSQNGLKSREDAVRMVCNFWEKWGRLVEMNYLPLWIFNGPSGDGAANILRLVSEDIKERRIGSYANKRYCKSFVWLVKQIKSNGYLNHWEFKNINNLKELLVDLEIKY